MTNEKFAFSCEDFAAVFGFFVLIKPIRESSRMYFEKTNSGYVQRRENCQTPVRILAVLNL